MTDVSRQRCSLHADREAVVRCPVCRGFFCRECVTEHEDRMLCNRCLTRMTDRATTGGGGRFFLLGVALQGATGFILLWIAFSLIGRMLLSIPSSFHEGTIWQAGWWKSP